MIVEAKILQLFNYLFNCRRGWAVGLQPGRARSDCCAHSLKAACRMWDPNGCLMELRQAVEGSARPRGGQAGCRSVSHGAAGVSTSSPPTGAPTVCFPVHTQAKVWCGTLTSRLCAPLCCNRGTGSSVWTMKPLAGGSWRSRLVPARARQDNGHACSAL